MKLEEAIVLLDAGHGIGTRGKCSPDGKYQEWAFAREMVRKIAEGLRGAGVDAREVVPEAADISIGQRAERVNAVCDIYGTKRVLMVSIHSNANSSDGQWHDGAWSGFIAEVSKNASTYSKTLADKIWKQAIDQGLRGNRSFRDRDGERYIVQDLGICRMTRCPAVLTESAFHDTHEGVELLTSAEGQQRIAEAHIRGILDYIISR